VGKYPHRSRGKMDGIGGLGKVNWEEGYGGLLGYHWKCK